MNRIISKHPRFANPTLWRKMRNPSWRMLRHALQKGEVATPGTFLDWLQKRMRTPARPRPVTQYRTRIRARIRARRSPASTRRATTDSGGDSGDGGGDPEPPRPRLYSLSPHAAGGAL